MEPIAPRTLHGLEHPIFLLRAVARVRAHALSLGLSLSTRTTSTPLSEEKLVYPITRAFAQDVGVVCGRYEADRLGGTRVEVARRMHALLHLVRRELRLVVYHDVVSRLDRALDPRVRLEIKVVIEQGRHALVDDRARPRIPILVGVGRVGREESGVVSLAADDDTQCWAVLGVLGIDNLEGLDKLTQFLF